MGIFLPSLPAAPGRSAADLGPSPLSLGGVALAHVLAAALITVYVPAERLADIVRPLAVRMIEPAAPQAEAKPLPPPPPVKAPLRPVAPPPVLTAAPTAPAAPIEFAVAPQPPAPPVASVPSASTSAVAPAVTPPRFDAAYLNNPKPVYPNAARRLGEEGKVVLRVHVTPEGRAAEIELKNSSGFARLDNAAREAVTQWRFVPARQGEDSVAAWVLVPIVFSLQG